MILDMLLVDDDAILLMMLQKMVSKTGLHPTPGKYLNGKLAFDHIIKNDDSETTFIVLLDLNMPVMNGWEFLEKINETNINSPVYVIIVTSSVDMRDRGKADSFKNVIHFMEKPVNEFKIKSLSQLPQIKHLFDI
jgi:CheY-like chemotaxis protein